MNATLESLFTWTDVAAADSFDWELLSASFGVVLNSGTTPDGTPEVEAVDVFDGVTLVTGSYGFRVRARLGSVVGEWSDPLPFDFQPLPKVTGLAIVG